MRRPRPPCRLGSLRRNRRWLRCFILSKWGRGYETIFLLDLFFGGLDGYDLFEEDDFGGAAVLPTLFEGEQEVGGQHDPAPT